VKETSKRLPRVQVAAWCWFCLVIFGVASLSAQDLQRSSRESLRSDVLKRISSANSAEITSLAAYEGVLDRNSYVLGPGDKLILQVWSPSYEELPTIVTGEGRVAVPFAGPVDVAGLSLADAEAAIEKEFNSALRKGRVSISLLEPRRFRVHVTGSVLLPGTYILPATARVADAVDEAGGFKRTVEFVSGDTVLKSTASMRRIELREQNGKVEAVDLLGFYQGGSLDKNPYLHDGAVVFVPTMSDGEEVGIFGEVRMPGLYEFAEGDDVHSLLTLAGGLTSLADPTRITLQSVDGTSREVDLPSESSSLRIHAGDRVYVGGTPKNEAIGSVTVTGQVTRPGGYSIVPGKTTVAELIEQIGGLLPAAAGQSARLIRNSDDRIESERKRLLLNPVKMTQKEDPAMLADLELSAEFSRWQYGTVVLDLSAQKDEPGWSGEVVLQDGDQLDVPSQPLGVRVLGYVNNAGEVPWVEGADLNHYLKEAGGKNSAGWKGRTVILKARNGSQLRYSSNMSVDPGDVLFVPQRPRTTGWERIKDVITVAAQVATIVLVIDTASKK
jgi:protein involved in polysaccharide export with SLBB domain